MPLTAIPSGRTKKEVSPEGRLEEQSQDLPKSLVGCRNDPWCSSDLKLINILRDYLLVLVASDPTWSPVPMEGFPNGILLLAGPLKNNDRTWSPAKPNNGLSWSFPGAFPEFPGLQTGCSMANPKILGFKYPAPHIPKWLTGMRASYFAQNTFSWWGFIVSIRHWFSEDQEIVKSLRGVL